MSTEDLEQQLAAAAAGERLGRRATRIARALTFLTVVVNVAVLVFAWQVDEDRPWVWVLPVLAVVLVILPRLLGDRVKATPRQYRSASTFHSVVSTVVNGGVIVVGVGAPVTSPLYWFGAILLQVLLWLLLAVRRMR